MKNGNRSFGTTRPCAERKVKLKMVTGNKTISLILSIIAIVAVTAVIVGCSKKQPEPTNADIVKAVIQKALSEKCNVLTPSIRIAAKGKRQQDGTIPYSVRYACMNPGKAGASRENEREATLSMYESKDSTGKIVWLAK